MNILQINTRYIGGGGAAAIANLLHREINSIDNMDSFFIYGRGKADDINTQKIDFEIESYISAAHTRIMGRGLNRKLSEQVKKQIDKADIVHIHNLHGYYINFELLIDYLIRKDKKIIWTLHDTWAITGRCAFTFGCNKWKIGCGNCENLKSYPSTNVDLSNELWEKKKGLLNRLKRENIIFVTPSRWLKELVAQSYLKDYRVEVINNGVEESKYRNSDKSEIRKALGLPLNTQIVLFVAADPNDERKGMKYILDIVNLAPDNMLFISIGKKVCGQNDKIKEFGYIKSKDIVNKIYRASDVFVIPSLDDNFPTTVLEAYSNGIPVVGFNTGGIVEQIKEGQTGYIVDKNSNTLERDLINKIIMASEISNSNLILEEFNKNYSLQKFINEYMNLYSSWNINDSYL